MKILIFSPYYPPHIGGLETHSDEFNKHLSQKGVDITVFTPRLPVDAPEKELRHTNVQIIRFPAFEVIHNYPLPKFLTVRFWKLLIEASRIKPNIIISRTRFFSTSFFALIYAKIRRIPLVHIEHGSDFAKFNSPFKAFLGKLYDYTFGKSILRFSDINIANSQASGKFIAQLSKRNDYRVIYRGVETETILATETKSGLQEKYSDKIIIGFIGRLIDGKGVSTLLIALSKIQRNDFVFFIIGDGPERKNLEKISQQPTLKNKVVFFGYKPPTEAIAIMKTCDIIINPSLTEGLPTSITEAALCKKAIIATNVGGTAEIITGNSDGFLIEPKNIELLQEKIEILLNDRKLRESFGRNAFNRTVNLFSWERAMTEYMTIFEEYNGER